LAKGDVRRSASTVGLPLIPGPSKAVKTTYGLHTLPLLGGTDLMRLNRPMIESFIEELDFVRALLSDELAKHWTTITAVRSVSALGRAKPLLTIEGAWRTDVPITRG
jgi:hypothetical protein